MGKRRRNSKIHPERQDRNRQRKTILQKLSQQKMSGNSQRLFRMAMAGSKRKKQTEIRILPAKRRYLIILQLCTIYQLFYHEKEKIYDDYIFRHHSL